MVEEKPTEKTEEKKVEEKKIVEAKPEVIEAEIKKWITQHNLTNEITLLGWQKDIAYHLKQWDAFVMSSLWEGLPCAIVEARLSKLPVVTYDVGGINEIIIHKKKGARKPPLNNTNCRNCNNS